MFRVPSFPLQFACGKCSNSSISDYLVNSFKMIPFSTSFLQLHLRFYYLEFHSRELLLPFSIRHCKWECSFFVSVMIFFLSINFTFRFARMQTLTKNNEKIEAIEAVNNFCYCKQIFISQFRILCRFHYYYFRFAILSFCHSFYCNRYHMQRSS